jgi:sulfate/thiosulfate transport system substrate-binding protein
MAIEGGPVPRIILAGLAAAVMLLAASCGGVSEGSAGAGGDGGKLTLVAYSTPREVYEELIPAFGETAEGAGVEFEQSYASSGEQSRAVESGLPASVVAFSLEPDVTRLVEAGLVEESWADDAYDGMVSRSVVVFAVRKGNPKNIKGWDDLIRDDVEVINANPFTSGGARWNVMAAFGAQLERGRSEGQAVAYIEALFRRISVQDKSARESLQTFAGGKGDVLLAYENEAITAQQKGEELDYIVPDQTILIENPIAVTKDAPEQAQAFVAFLRTPESQRVFAEKGYRSIIDGEIDEATYPAPETLFTIADLGGWPEVQERYFDREDGIVARIQREIGAPLE